MSRWTALFLVTLTAVTGLAMWYWFTPGQTPSGLAPKSPVFQPAPDPLLQDWPHDQLTLVVSGEQHMEPMFQVRDAKLQPFILSKSNPGELTSVC